MTNRTRASILQNLDAEVSVLVAKNRGVSEMDGLRLFLNSETHKMLEDDDLKMWYFSPLALFDMWETEIATGDPRDSVYLKGDEYA
ncbi:hypothetical protein FACS1894190_13760 [Spirochaetia bacterium]|nr:hypothetical protein FACS1894190_13760 [Spirochaetia bacterium]